MLKFVLLMHIMVLVITILLGIYGAAFGAESLTLSPVSFTLHGKHGPIARENFINTPFDDSTTIHPGFSLLYKNNDSNYQGSAWYFLDSFGNKAGGVVAGPQWSFLGEVVGVGVIGGVYVREDVPVGIQGFPMSVNVGDIEIAPLAAVTLSGAVPVSDQVAVEVNCAVNYIVNNCQVGLRFEF